MRLEKSGAADTKLARRSTGVGATLKSARLAGHRVDLHFDLGLVGREVDDIVVAVVVPFDVRDIVERVALLDGGNDGRELERVVRRNRRRLASCAIRNDVEAARRPTEQQMA